MTMGRARRRLLDAAARRFYADGIAATGIDTVTAEAGVAKMSLYNNFSSKEELVLAYLHERHAEWLELCGVRTEAASNPAERVLAVFDAYLDHAATAYEAGFRGCGLLNGAAELPAGHPGREAVRQHKQEVRTILAERLAEGGVGDPEGLAEHLYLLVEGAVVTAGLQGSQEAIERARELAATLLATAGCPGAAPGAPPSPADRP
ncbi:TetR/AcrR family transcriptional regulator [Haloechinothrix sp. LS1_15]|uniref:TetR/AcrR family transcriptional regulator n=1 Tax=Haloechinothrix sp. LS1_15 TaxID=2652248 RepID=UPI00294618A5|nr:TetR/AcrR family transcriptional regulator [Haloechinothrix sp. LS1_15]MDV6012509.1 TetR/AcrR family transcriptional regulator [Haloechinothrix sp. LS1_15]